MFRKLIYGCVILTIITISIIFPSATKAAQPLDTYNDELQLLLKEQNKVSPQLKQAQSKLTNLLATHKTISLAAQKKRTELDVLQTKLTAQRKQISTLNQQIKEYRKNNKALLKGTKSHKAKYSKELSDLQVKYKGIQKKATSLKNEVTRINQQYTDIKNKLNQNKNDITEIRKPIASINETLRKITSSILIVNNKIEREKATALNNSSNSNNNNYSSGTDKIEYPPKTQENVSAAEPYLIDSDSLTENEKELARLINEYRQSVGLSPLPISKSLTKVARTHVNDSNQYSAEKGVDVRGVKCNLHSWSANGTWSSVCYTRDHEYSGKMWSKPKELTNYQGNGYEISVYSSAGISPSQALTLWQGSPGHNNVIIGKDFWANLTVMGVGIHEGYAHVWFGVEADPAGYME